MAVWSRPLSGQEINWSSLTISIAGQWIAPQRNFGTYWNNGPGFSLHADVRLDNPLFLLASATLSTHSVAETPKKPQIPPVVLIQLGGGFLIGANQTAPLRAGLGVQLVNNTFIFSGPAARPGFENTVESEFGIAFTGMLTWKSGVLPPLQALLSYQPILVGLEPVAVLSFGLGVRLE